MAACRDDDVALAAAHAAVEEWGSVLRTRRVLVAGTGTACAGTRRAVALAEEAVGPNPRTVHLLGGQPGG